MNKLFFAICFSLISINFSYAKITEIHNKSQIPAKQQDQQTAPQPVEVSADILEDFLTDRFENAIIMDKDKVNTSSTNTQPSEQALRAFAESQKGTFQKIYEQALKRIDKDAQNKHPDINFTKKNNVTKQAREWNKPGIATLVTELPTSNTRVKIPAKEHIPYLMTNIEVLPEGTLKFTETVMVVADGKKLRHGLTRVLPEYIYNRHGKKQKIDYSLIEVSANNSPIKYDFKSGQNLLFLSPAEVIELSPGIYTYKFEYLADNVLLDTGDTKELYWNTTGSAWNLVITRSGATLTLPEGVVPLSQEVLLGSAKHLVSNSVVGLHPSDTTWGYASQRPLFGGEGFHLIVSLPNDDILQAPWDKKLLRSFNTYSDVYISFVTFIAIALSFLFSWKYIKENKGQLKINLKKTPPLIRFLALNRYDIKSFGGFILELYRKNIIDIQQADETILLVKRTDNLKSLSANEQKAMDFLFTQNEPVLNINKNNRLKIIRAARLIEKDLRKNLWKFLLQLNSGYIAFSGGMLLLGEIFMSLATISPGITFLLLCTATFLSTVGAFLVHKKYSSRPINIANKICGSGLIILSVVMLAAIISWWSILFILLSIFTILHYTSAYAQRNGLLKKYIEDIAKQKESLLKHKESIVIGREIANQQPLIWVLDMEDEFINNSINEYNKLLAMKYFIQKQLK